jgi:hypothetical protein
LGIIELSKELDKYAIKLEVQVSLDGDSNITDKNRHPDSTKYIIEHFQEVYQKCPNVKFHFKPTISIDNIKNDLDTFEKVLNWFKFFDQLILPNVPSPTPTFVVPGNYTSEDGKLAAEWFKNLTKVKVLNQQQHILKHYAETNNYVLRFQRLLNFNRELQYKFRTFTCSGGDTQVGLDFNGNAHICHHTFYYDNPDYFNQAFGDAMHKRAFENTSFKIDDEFNKSRVLYTNRAYHYFMRFKINTTSTIIKELMLCGQVSDDFKDDDLTYILALFIHTAFSCPIENKCRTGSILIPPISLIRLLGNGCIQEIIRSVLI